MYVLLPVLSRWKAKINPCFQVEVESASNVRLREILCVPGGRNSVHPFSVFLNLKCHIPFKLYEVQDEFLRFSEARNKTRTKRNFHAFSVNS